MGNITGIYKNTRGITLSCGFHCVVYVYPNKDNWNSRNVTVVSDMYIVHEYCNNIAYNILMRINGLIGHQCTCTYIYIYNKDMF